MSARLAESERPAALDADDRAVIARIVDAAPPLSPAIAARIRALVIRGGRS